MIKISIEGDIEDIKEFLGNIDEPTISASEQLQYREHIQTPDIDWKEMIEYISESTSTNKEIVEEILESEEDYLYWKGIIEY